MRIPRVEVPLFHDERTRMAEAAIFASRIDQLEFKMREKMGWLAIDGVRNLSSLGMGIASVVGLAFSILALTAVHLMPGLGLIVFASVVVGGVLLGATAQALARWLWSRRNEAHELRSELLDIRQKILAQSGNSQLRNLLDAEIRQLRRLERLEMCLNGGFTSALVDAMIGLFGWDPRLNHLLSRAAYLRQKSRPRS